MDTQDEALVGPNPRDEVIREIVKIKEKQLADEKANIIQREKDSFNWATKELAKRYFGLSSLDYFDTKKLSSLQDLIYEKARKAYICHTIMLALTPFVGWIVLGIRSCDDDISYCWPTRKFVKLYKKFKKQEDDQK